MCLTLMIISDKYMGYIIFSTSQYDYTKLLQLYTSIITLYYNYTRLYHNYYELYSNILYYTT